MARRQQKEFRTNKNQSVNKQHFYSIDVLEMYSPQFKKWSNMVYAIVLILGIRRICQATDYEFRIDILPACSENANNLIRLESLDFMRMNHNRFILNGSLVIDEAINGPIQVSQLAMDFGHSFG